MSKKDLKGVFEEGRDVSVPSFSDTVELVKARHLGHTDKNGEFFYLHLLRVAANLRAIYPEASQDMVNAALLHDAIEDDMATESELRDFGYSSRTIELVKIVTRPDNDRRPYSEFISDIIAAGEKEAMIIKIADNMDNLNPARIEAIRQKDEKTADRLFRKYSASIERLCQQTGIDLELCDRVMERYSMSDNDLDGTKYYIFDGRPVKVVREEGLLVETYSVDQATGQLTEDDLLGIHIEKDGPEQEITEIEFEALRSRIEAEVQPD